MPQNVIEVEQVSRRFGAVLAVDGIDLAVREGEIFGLIGHNGAGKSTLFKLMLGLLAPNQGSIRIRGQSVRGAAFRALRRKIAYLPENVVFYDNLTGLETLRFFAELKGASRDSCLPLLEQVGLTHAARRPVRGYSKGMRQRLGFAQALLGDPHILFLDEPTTGLDPEGIREFYRILQHLRQQGVTALLSSHNLAEIQGRVDRLALMKAGHVQALGTVRELGAQLDLPLEIQLVLRADAGPALCELLTAFGDCKLQLDSDQALLRCPRQHKLAVLGLLTSRLDLVLDLHVHEPTLEDVFLGYVDA